MKKFLLIGATCIAMTLSLTACGSDYKVTLADYDNISISQADIDAEIQSIREAYPVDTTIVTEGTVADGDTVDISFVGTVDGVAFDGGTAENQELVIGSGTYIDGFEEGIVGKEIGSTFDINVTFPDDYSSTDLAGKDAVFSITVNSVNIPVLSDFTDEWVTSISEEVLGEALTTTAEFEKSVASFLILDKVFSDSTLEDYDAEVYELMVADQLEYYENYAAEQGIELEYLLSVYGTSEEDLAASVLDTIKWQAIIFEIASLENITADEEYESTVLEEAVAAGYETVDEYLEGEEIPDYYLDYTRAYALYPKIVDILVDASTITE